jgi:hypothetical protein
LTDTRELLNYLRTHNKISRGALLTEEARLLYKDLALVCFQADPTTERWHRLDKLVHRARLRFIRRDAANHYGVYEEEG